MTSREVLEKLRDETNKTRVDALASMEHMALGAFSREHALLAVCKLAEAISHAELAMCFLARKD